MRLVGLLVACLGTAAPALAQQCDVITPAGDIFQASTARGKAAVGWDVKRFEHLGQESEHFSRPALSLTFAVGSDGALAGPLEATVSITSNSDLSLGAAPPISAMRLRAKLDDRPSIEWNAASVSGEVLLAKALRDAWPRRLVIAIVAQDRAVVGSAAYDVAARTAAETAVRGLPADCFR
jgi:hypothetical protein